MNGRTTRLGTASTGYDFSYDATGRLVEVTAPDGEAARYVYDPAGNILAIERYPAGTLAILSFDPSQGGPGQLVTVTGVGFSAVPSENAVQINGTAVPVVSGTTAQVAFIVPQGATTGRISVSVAASTATSAADFTVTNPAVSISDFSPRIGKVGTAFTVMGQGFDPDPLNDGLRIGTMQQSLSAAATTSLQAVVSRRTVTGRITVQTPIASAVSADPFVIVPVSYATTDVGSTTSATIGTTVAVNVATAGKVALLYFDVSAAQGITLFVSGVTFAGTTNIEVFSPDGISIFFGTVTPGAPAKLDVGLIAFPGTYTIICRPPATSTGTLNLQILSDAAGTVQVDGDSFAAAIGAGQNGRYTFAGTVGDLLGLGVPQLTTNPANTSVSFQVVKPDGTVTTCAFPAPSSCQIPVLPMTGIHTLRVIPANTASATTTVLLSRPLTGVLTADGTVTRYQTSRVGQTGRYTFSATAGQSLSLRATTSAGFPHSIWVNVYRPDGVTQVAGGLLSSASDSKFDLNNLPVTGTYLVQVVPNSVDIGTADLRLFGDVLATLNVDDVGVSMTIGSGQNGRYTFAGTAGDLLGLGVTQLTTSPANAGASFQVVRPEGTNLATCFFSAPSSCQLPALPVTGTYTLRVIPGNTASAATTALLSRPLTGVVASDGTPTTYQTSRAGQTGRYTFSATAGQNFSLRATTSAGFPNRVLMNVYRPDGVTQVTSGLLSSATDSKFDLNSLPVTGTYLVQVVPGNADTGGTVGLRLFGDVAAALNVDDVAVPMTIGTGQNGRYTFAGTTGDLLGIGVTQLTTSPANVGATLQLVRPDGANLTTCFFSAPSSCQLPALTVTGTYTLRVIPANTASATTTVLLSRPLTGVLTSDGTVTTYQTSRAGQSGRYTFSATAGQNFSFRATTSAGFPYGVSVNIYRPNGVTLVTGGSFFGPSDTKFDLNNLPVTGTYLVQVVPSAADTGGAVDLRLWPDAVGTLAIDGASAALTMNTGQNGRYTFAGSANDLLTLALSQLSFTPAGSSASFQVLKPDGTALTSCTLLAAGSCTVAALPVAGTYSIRVIPSGTSAASDTAQLTRR